MTMPRVLPAPADDPARLAAAAAEAAAVLRAGGLVALPTETVYGLAANALDAAAVQRIYAAKGRPSYNPLIVHVTGIDALAGVVADVTPLARRLAAAFWPGPLTLVLPRAAGIPDAVSAGLPTVGVRAPAHPVAQAVLAAAGLPLAAPSANPFTRISPTSAQHVVDALGDRVDLVLDGGACGVGIESTVVDATGERPVLLRPGAIGAAAIERVAGVPLTRAAAVAGDAARPAPGMIERHYAPRARLYAFGSGDRGRLSSMLAPSGVALDRPVGLIAFDARGLVADLVLELPREPAGYARGLYAALHDLDRAGCAVAFVEDLPPGSEWEAIADRLRRAGLQSLGELRTKAW
jgi:L-threonylcarbamoyladenylate synthase